MRLKHGRLSGGRIASLATATIVATAVACNDQATAPRAAPASTSDFVAEGVVYNRIWSASKEGLRLAGTTSMPTMISRTQGRTSSSYGRGSFVAQDTQSAPVQRWSEGSLLAKEGAGRGSPGKVVMKGRKISKQRVDGKEIALIAVPDDDRRSGRPAKAMLILVDNRITAITEYKWARKASAWRVNRSRTTVLDEKGEVAIVAERDASAMRYRNGPREVGLLQEIRGGMGAAISHVARLVQPDMLHAAAPETAEEFCWSELGLAAGAAAGVVAAGLLVEAAKASLVAAELALVAARATCPENPAGCALAIVTATYLLASAKDKVAAAYLTLSTAISAAAYADEKLSECFKRFWSKPPDETQTGPSGGGGGGGGEGDCGDGGEEWCQWTLSWGTGTLNVHRDYCWCEGGGWEM